MGFLDFFGLRPPQVGEPKVPKQKDTFESSVVKPEDNELLGLLDRVEKVKFTRRPYRCPECESFLETHKRKSPQTGVLCENDWHRPIWNPAPSPSARSPRDILERDCCTECGSTQRATRLQSKWTYTVCGGAWHTFVPPKEERTQKEVVNSSGPDSGSLPK